MPSSPELGNIQAIIDLERETRRNRSLLERITDRVTATAGSATFIVVHVLWFTCWIVVNSVRASPFDRYPFSLLTLTVSLEAIVLTGFVLMAQNRMTVQADRRAHLDLQINLLAEQELTAILRTVSVLAQDKGIDLATIDPRLPELLDRTDVRRLADTLNTELDAVDELKKR